MIFKRSGCFQFTEVVVTSTAKESLHSTERGSLQVLAVFIGVVTAMNNCKQRQAYAIIECGGSQRSLDFLDMCDTDGCYCYKQATYVKLQCLLPCT